MPPRRIAPSFLFIALHIICVRRSPDAPTIPPTATSNKSLIARPAIAPATPERLLSSEIVMGISAPPTRIAKMYPKNPEMTNSNAIIIPQNAFRSMPRAILPLPERAAIAAKTTISASVRQRLPTVIA